MTKPTDVARRRGTLLLNHANPAHNEFMLWLALQFANEGCRRWCDLTILLGGEMVWGDIEETMKTRAVKVLHVLSRTSNLLRVDQACHELSNRWRNRI
jgi:hypothetical protein